MDPCKKNRMVNRFVVLISKSHQKKKKKKKKKLNKITKSWKQNIWFWNTSTRLVKQLWQSIFGGLSFHNFDFYTNLACVSRGFFEITTTIWCLSGNANWQNLDTLWCQPNHQLSRCTSESRNLVTASMTFLILRRALRSRSRNISNFFQALTSPQHQVLNWVYPYGLSRPSGTRILQNWLNAQDIKLFYNQTCDILKYTHQPIALASYTAYTSTNIFSSWLRFRIPTLCIYWKSFMFWTIIDVIKYNSN